MKNLLIPAVVCTALGVAALGSYVGGAQQPAQAGTERRSVRQQSRRRAPQQFPLAAPAGKDSGARKAAPAGAVNQGPFDPATWKYGPAFNPPPGAKIWNPVKLKMMQGGKVTGGTLFSATDPATYCAMANAGYDFIWTEMQHDQHDWQAVGAHVAHLPACEGRPGRRGSPTPTSGKSSTRSTPARSSWSCRPSIRRPRRSQARNWTYFPPLGRRSAGGGQAFEAPMWGGVPGGYRQHHQRQHRADPDDRDARRREERRRDREGPGRDGDLRGERRPRQLLRLSGRARPTTSARSTSSTTRPSRRSVRLCGPLAWRDRPDFTLLPGGQRNGGDRSRRRRGARSARQHASETGSRAIRHAGEAVTLPSGRLVRSR